MKSLADMAILVLCVLLTAFWAGPVQGGPKDEEAILDRLDILKRQKKYDDALELVRELGLKVIQTYGKSHPKVGEVMNRAAEYHLLDGDFATAERLSKLVLARFGASGPAYETVIRTAKTRLVLLYMSQDRVSDAEALELRPEELARDRSSHGRGATDQEEEKTLSGLFKGWAAPVSGRSPNSQIAPRQLQDRSKRSNRVAALVNGQVDSKSPTPLQRSNGASPDAARGAARCTAPDIRLLLDGLGNPRISFNSMCHADQLVKLQYGRFEFAYRVDASGAFEMDLDLFQGPETLASLVFENGHRQALQLPEAIDDRVTKVAVVWTSPVELQLHAFEYAAQFGSVGHVSKHQPRSAESVQRVVGETGRGFGFMSSVGTDEGNEGRRAHRAEVYTLVHAPKQRFGAVKLVLDYASRGDVPRGDFCENGKYATPKYEVYVLRPSGRLRHEVGQIPAALCGQKLTHKARYMWSAIPDIRIRK